jgi:hypothetical protein
VLLLPLTLSGDTTQNIRYLYKAPARGRDPIPELTQGFNPAQYPGDGPYFSLNRGLAVEFAETYGNGLQIFNLSEKNFQALSQAGVIQTDTQYAPGVAIHVPPAGLSIFNGAILQGPPNVYIPPGQLPPR